MVVVVFSPAKPNLTNSSTKLALFMDCFVWANSHSLSISRLLPEQEQSPTFHISILNIPEYGVEPSSPSWATSKRSGSHRVFVFFIPGYLLKILYLIRFLHILFHLDFVFLICTMPIISSYQISLLERPI